MTCSPGTAIYSIFGHSAIWVHDPLQNIDLVFNYGTFDFNTPNFYLKFIKGKLNYQLSVTDYPYFELNYVSLNRSIFQQVLYISQEDKQTLFNYLLINYLPENRYYRYDFFFDNCATRIRDIIEKALQNKIEFDYSKYNTDKSFRELLKPYIKDNKWLDLGINLLLGLPGDRTAKPYEYMLIPDYIQEIFAEAKLKSGEKITPLVDKTQIIFEESKNVKEKNILFSPTLVFWLLFIVISLITYFDFRKNRLSYWIDIPFFIIIGLLGLLLSFQWFATEHTVMGNNLNLIWAIPFHFPISFFLFRKRKTKLISYYFLVSGIISALLILTWVIIPQKLHISLIPVVLTLAIRGLNIYLYESKSIIYKK